MPIVSIIIPTYNGANYIRSTVDSILSQNFDDLEIVITDDNSKDDTVGIIRSYSDPRIHVFSNGGNLGAEGNWNCALALASGKYIKLVPQDDLLEPNSLAEQVAVLENDVDERIALVFGARKIIGPDGRVLTRRGFPSAGAGLIAAKTLIRQCVRRGTNLIGEPGAVLFRGSLAKRVGRFDGRQGYVIDLDYWVRLLAHGDGWYMPRTVSSFRVSRGSWSVAIGAGQSRQFSDFLKRMCAEGLMSLAAGDLAIGKVNALKNNVMRMIFYNLIVR
jgi:glycosyltransferase involved in cell wall biosynthesis